MLFGLSRSCPLLLRPLDGNTRLSQMHSWAPLQVLHGDTDVLFPVSGVASYSPAECLRCSHPSKGWAKPADESQRSPDIGLFSLLVIFWDLGTYKLTTSGDH
ncbi:hypothetical protein GH733_012389 [Mirounga leonina]|nr:hypothetical protein GH733_012389 [Mirounga leonina]